MLFGAVAPAARLPVSVPASPKQLPPYLDMGMATAPGRTHRYYDGSEGASLWPFGFGMSTTTFAYSGLKVAKGGGIRVSIRVANTGNRTSDEVTQIYTGFRNITSAESAPLQELKAFRRVASLAPASALDLHFEIPLRGLRLMSSAGVFAVLPGTYDLWAGGRSPMPSGGPGVLGAEAIGTPHRPLHATFVLP